MSLAYCAKCLNRIEDCTCEGGAEQPFIYGEIRRAIEVDKRGRKVPNPAEFYSHGSMEITYLDRWIYRGKGRPRKTDYSTISLLQKKINATYSAMLEAKSLGGDGK